MILHSVNLYAASGAKQHNKSYTSLFSNYQSHSSTPLLKQLPTHQAIQEHTDLYPRSDNGDRQERDRDEIEVTRSMPVAIGEYCPKMEYFVFEAGNDGEVWEEMLCQINGGRFKYLCCTPTSPVLESCLDYANLAIPLSKNLDMLFIQPLVIQFDDVSRAPLLNKNLKLHYDMLVKNLKSFARLEVLCIGEINGLVRCISRHNHVID